MRVAGIVLLAMAVLGIQSAMAGDFSLALTVREPSNVARKAEPVSGGVPFPAGMFKKDQAFALFDGTDEVPLQTSVLNVDKDGFLRWVLADFQTDLAAGASKTFTLKAVAGKAAPATPLKVTDAADGVTIDTGKAKLAISKTKPFALFDSVSAGGKAATAGGSASYTDAFSNKTFQAGVPESVTVEYAGPLRTTVWVKGHFVDDPANKLGYVARVTAWAGHSRVLVKYSLCNSNPDQYVWRAIKDSTISLKLADKVTASTLGASKPLEAGAEAKLVQGLKTDAAKAAKAMDGEKELWASAAGEKDVAVGFLAARTASGAVMATDRFFSENPARALAVAGGSLAMTGVMERFEVDNPNPKEKDKGKPYGGKPRTLCDSSHLSSEYVIDFAPPADADAMLATAQIAREECHAVAPPDAYAHDALLPIGPFGTQADELACYDAWGWKYDTKNLPTRFSCQWPYNNGYPRWFWGMDAHYDPEEDCIEQMLLMYMRTGSRFYFANARSWANYYEDLCVFRTDGWRFKDGGVWWNRGGPKGGNAPQRIADPVTGLRHYLINPWDAKKAKAPMTPELACDLCYITDAKGCHCHNWAEGLVDWYFLTGDRDALEAAVDRVEQDYDYFARAAKFEAGKADQFVREYNRSMFNAQAVRLALPDDEFVRQASEYFVGTYLKRPNREPRGLVNAAHKSAINLKDYVGAPGLAALTESGNTFDAKTGEMTDPKTGQKWVVNRAPHTWMYPPVSQAMDLYYRLTGNEDAMDWVIAYGQAAARVLYQAHGQLTYELLLVDFPKRGVCKDLASWTLPPGDKYAEHMKLEGFLARFHPDVCARAYSLCGDPLLKQRAYDFWFAGSHRGYQEMKMHDVGGVGMWANYYGDHDGELDFMLHTLYIWGQPRKDEKAPAAVKDLAVTVNGEKATVTFSAPADEGGGKAARYQVKCSDKPIVDYDEFLDAYNKFQDDKCCNWWMAANVQGEPAPKAAGQKESFEVTGLPAGAKYFAVRSFDDSNNRSAMSNQAESK
jgi:hypothetical protein